MRVCFECLLLQWPDFSVEIIKVSSPLKAEKEAEASGSLKQMMEICPRWRRVGKLLSLIIHWLTASPSLLCRQVDLFQLQVNTLRRYKRHYKLQTRPGLNKAQLAEVEELNECGDVVHCMFGVMYFALYRAMLCSFPDHETTSVLRISPMPTQELYLHFH